MCFTQKAPWSQRQTTCRCISKLFHGLNRFRYTCKYVQVFFTTHSTNIHKPPSALSNNHVETLASRDVWSFSGPFSRRDVVPATSWHVASGQVGKGGKQGWKDVDWNVCKVQKSTVPFISYIIAWCKRKTSKPSKWNTQLESKLDFVVHHFLAGTFALKGLVRFGALVFAPSLQFCFRTSTLSLNSINSWDS